MRIKNIAVALILLMAAVSIKAQNPTSFKLNSATDDSQFSLRSAKGKYVALHFLLKTECPYCIRHTQDYFSKAKDFPNLIQVFIKPDTEKEIEAWATKIKVDGLDKFPIYLDPDAKLAKQFNIPDGYAFHKQLVHYPALILLGPDGKEIFRYIGKNNSDRYSFEQLTAKVHELSVK